MRVAADFLGRNVTRGAELLERLARFAKWEKRTAPKREAGDVVAGRGVAYVKYELVRTYVGAVADVEVDRKSGALRVVRFFVVHDCGQIINPDGVKAQIEGNVIQTTSRALKEELTFDRSRVTSLDWASYPILTFPEVPEIAIDLIDRPTEKPWGAGEPATAVVPSKRRLSRDGRASALGAVHTGEGQSGDTGRVISARGASASPELVLFRPERGDALRQIDADKASSPFHRVIRSLETWGIGYSVPHALHDCSQLRRIGLRGPHLLLPVSDQRANFLNVERKTLCRLRKFFGDGLKGFFKCLFGSLINVLMCNAVATCSGLHDAYGCVEE